MHIALAGLAFIRGWKNVAPVLLIGTIVSYSVYLARDDTTTPVFRAVIAILFYAIFAWLPTVADDNKAKLVASKLIREYPDNVSALEHDIVKGLQIAGHALIVSALSFEA